MPSQTPPRRIALTHLPVFLLLALSLLAAAWCTEPAAAQTVAGGIAVVSPVHGTSVTVGSEFVIELSATNSGSAPWPKTCRVVETVAGQADRTIALVVAPRPRETVPFFVQGLAGDQAGRFQATFALLDGSRELGRATVDVAVEPAPPSPPAELMAEIVSLDFPASLKTDEIFTVTAVIKNTGTVEWPNSPIFHLAWRGFPFGAPGIYFGQGRTVAPGAEAKIEGSMRAPSAPGTYTASFVMVRGDDWGIGRDHDVEISVPTRRTKVTVSQGPFTPLPREDRPGKLSDSDLTYLGSFAMPRGLEGLSTGFTGSGIALRSRPGKPKTLFANAGPNGGPQLYEVEIPEPSQATDGEQLPQAKVVAFYGDIYAPRGPNEKPNVTGLHFDAASRTLYWSCLHGYYSGAAGTILGATRIDDDGKATAAGTFTTSDTHFKGYWGGMTAIDPAFADKHLGGRRLGLGFGGTYSICQTTSEGPAFAAIATPDPAKPTLDLVRLITYPFGQADRKPCVRPGNYFLSQIWGEQPKDAGTGWFSAADAISAGAWISYGGKQGLIFFPTLSEGWICYHYAAIHMAKRGRYRYLYDPDDIAGVAHGKAKPWELKPYSITSYDPPIGGDVTGAAFDQETGRLYVNFDHAYKAGVELYPIVAVYQIGKAP